ncbi:AraC family transcriptional regulator [Thermocrispum municipale]|uniref:AraC family transcriptional regulator n=1 Tax=Thermocrispum municipale TaxID=37926 RepID=UPI000428B42C|nr:AraC family transcriptional regulator [Thermocrispum municipale]
MADDELSEVFSLVEVQGVLTGAVAASGAWVARGPIPHPLKFFVMLSGRAHLRTEGLAEPVELEAGDVGIFSDRSWVELRGGLADETPQLVEPHLEFPPAALVGADERGEDVYVGGRIDLNPAGETLLSQALPPFSHVRANEPGAEGLRDTVRRLFDELVGQRLGSAFAVRQHVQLLLLEMLRAYLRQAEAPPAGWLRLLADERLRPAVRLMHRQPGRSWGLAELADACAMSRAAFADRFRKVAGLPPLTYLSRWRMMLAQRALSDDNTRIASLAARLGYGSESAFSNAFKREVGISPASYRRKVREAALSV